jgi:FAD:protein FMN transferase
MTQRKKKVLFSVLALLLVVLLIIGVLVFRGGVHRQGIQHEYLSMGTTVSDQIYAKEATADDVSESIQKRLSTLDANELSWRISASYIAKLNKDYSVAVDDNMASWVQTCLDVSKQSGGVFDITVGSLSTLWGIGTEDARVPSDEEIQEAKKTVGWESVSIQPLAQPESGKAQEIRIGEGQFVDLGAVGKGIACDEAYTILKASSVDSAIVSVAGSILLYGENPNSSDGTWSVGIRDPQGDANSYCGILTLPEGFVSTSGNYEKVLEVDGKKYHHILDPRTGYPAESGLSSVTVVAPTGLLADALSTACFILGYSEDSLQLLEHYQASAVFITSDGTVYTTGDLSSCLQLTGSAYTLGKEST